MTKVSVIITTFRDRNYAERCLKSIRRSEGSKDFEIIVVDDDPNEPPIPDVIFLSPTRYDGSDELAPLTDTDTTYWVKPSENKEKWGLFMCREMAMRKSTGDYIVTCDSDIVVPKHWWTTFNKLFKIDPKIAAIGPRIFPAWNQWAQYLPHEDTLKKYGAVKDLTPEGIDTFDMNKYIPEWWEINYIPDVHNILKAKYGYGKGSEEDRQYDWPLDDIIRWDCLSDAFACFTKDILYKLRTKPGVPCGGLGVPYPDYRDIFNLFSMKVVVSNRVAVWCGRESPTTTTAPYIGAKNEWHYKPKK